MRGGVGGIAELIGNEGVGDFTGQLLGFGNRAFHARCAVGENQLGTVGLHQLPALQAHGLRHDDDHAIAAGRADRGETDAGVAGSGFNDDGFLCQESFRFRIVDHGPGHAILGRAGGIKVLQLGKNRGLQAFCLLQAGQFQQRGFADQLINGCKNCRHVEFLLQNKKPEGPSAFRLN